MKQRKITFAICGCGSRGLDAYAQYQKLHPEEMEIVAAADSRPERLELLREQFGVPQEKCFSSDEELLEQPRLADAMIIATQDQQHVPDAWKALERGYHLLLEKPISDDIGACLRLQKKAHEMQRAVVVCHVLRYADFYRKLHELIEDGQIGKLETICATEQIGYWHFAHSYVRGNWRRSEDTSPMILAKSCHDMDLLRWLCGSRCLQVQSFGSLDFFKEENAPEGASLRCLDGCTCRKECIFDPEKIYITNPATGVDNKDHGAWLVKVVADRPDRESVREAIRRGPYGRCVFHCDNDVADHQTVNLLFENNVTATFTVTAFSESNYRTIRVSGTKGEIEGNLEKNKLYLQVFGQERQVIDLSEYQDEFTGHGGGDMHLMQYFCRLIASGQTEGLTGIDVSVESHAMAMAAEESRLQGGRTIRMSEYMAERV